MFLKNYFCDLMISLEFFLMGFQPHVPEFSYHDLRPKLSNISEIDK